MLGALLVLIIIAGFALHQYIKGSIVKGFIFLMAAIIGAAAAFGYYELVAGYIKDYSFIGANAYPLAFLALFILVLVAIKEVAKNILKPNISFGLKIDRAGGAAIGVLVGYVAAGAIFITIGLLPYKTGLLHSRFEDSISNPPQASGVLLNPDGFLSGLFGVLSSGSLKGTNSFSVVHADYLDQIFLNRHFVGDGVPSIAADGAVSISTKGVRAAPENLTEAAGQNGEKPQQVGQEAGKTLTLVRLKINSGELVPGESADLPKLALAQLRLVIKDKQSAGDLTSGSGKAIYPIGYLNSEGQLQTKSLNTVLDDKELKADNINFAFYVPADSAPVLMEFRQNILEEIGQVGAAEEIPAAQQPATEKQSSEQPPSEAPPTEAPAAEQPTN